MFTFEMAGFEYCRAIADNMKIIVNWESGNSQKF